MPPNDRTPSLETYPALECQPETLDRIARLNAPADGVLSVYLDVAPSEAQREGFEAALLDIWKPLRAPVRGTDLEIRLEQEIDRVNAYVRSWDEPPGRSVAIFTSSPCDAFLPLALDVPVLAGARFEPGPYLLPLIAALDEHERYCVVLVDKEHARILLVWMGRIRERQAFKDLVPGRTAAGGWSQAGYARHRDYHIHLHMRRVIDELWGLSRRAAFDRLIIGGPAEAMAALRPMLPRSLASRLVGEFTGETFASDAELLERVRGIEERAERAHEVALVRDALERALKGELAVIGWDDTLTALSEGRVHQLVLVEGATSEGFVCAEDHYALRGRLERCPFCGEPLWPVADLAAWATRRALATDAAVELVRGEAAEMLRAHGAAALLRYR